MARVFVYFNLHKLCLSIKALDGAMRGRVIAHATAVELLNPVFKVSEAGRQRVLRERSKNVHAGIVGELSRLVRFDEAMPADFADDLAAFRSRAQSVTYDPYRFTSFVNRHTHAPLLSAQKVMAVGKDVLAF